MTSLCCQLFAVNKRAITLNPIIALSLKNPAAGFFTAKRKSQRGKRKIEIIMHHSEVGINLKMEAPPSVQPEIGTVTHSYNIFN